MSAARPAPPTALSLLDDGARAEYWATLALRRTKGLGARSICRLLRHFGSAYAAVYNVARWSEAGVSPNKGEGLSGDVWRLEARPEWEDSRDLEGRILLWTDPLYPLPLKELPDAPALLYARGDLSLLNNACVAVVGSRACSREGLTRTHAIARELSACGVTVVSGLARGIDYAAHKAALPEQGRTIAVLGAGLDVIYPPQHRELYQAVGVKGLLLSEFPPGTRPEGPHFPIRNRIISGLALGVVVVEAAPRSGSLITARLALDQNRAVYAVPPPGYTPESSPHMPAEDDLPDGCSRLLAQGARPALGAADILADLLPQLQDMLKHLAPEPTPAPAPPPRPRRAAPPIPSPASGPKPDEPPSAVPPLPVYPPGSPEECALAALREHGPLSVDDLLPLLPGHDAGSLSGLLLMLEVAGAVRRRPGMIYEAMRP